MFLALAMLLQLTRRFAAVDYDLSTVTRGYIDPQRLPLAASENEHKNQCNQVAR